MTGGGEGDGGGGDEGVHDCWVVKRNAVVGGRKGAVMVLLGTRREEKERGGERRAEIENWRVCG